ncbi:homogentisate 1,2-dioxygenase [Oligoflexaceae bacterium]|nr:homogentisate 1,2-dioxygenase [Oligoflexaceae bacterium]
MSHDLSYLKGFGNHFESEALPNSLPEIGNNPQKCPRGLYAEQLSGTSFLAPSDENLKTWLYKIRPSVSHSPYKPYQLPTFQSSGKEDVNCPPDQLRWDPMPDVKGSKNFIESLFTVCTTGDFHSRSGCAVHLYSTDKSMENECFYNADGEFLIVPQMGSLLIQTELGYLDLSPNEIAVVPRGIKFRVELKDGQAAGYICENYGQPLTLPYRGPIGANGLANERDFLTPVAHFEESSDPYKVIAKFEGNLWETTYKGSVFDTVAWHGNYAPYKYDLGMFNTINTVSFDHPDPSIFTVLTSPSLKEGTSNIDFVIFPPRWMVATNTFRPPYYHRNFMSEYMGLIHGVYDAKPKGGGFSPGSGSLHNCMTAHGPDSKAFEAASNADLKPEYIKDTMAFMFETSTVLKPTKQALECSFLQKNYIDESWGSLKPAGPLDRSK